LRDRTQERRYENFLVQSQKLESIGILAAGLAHEVNNPLAYVRANLSFLQSLSETIDKNIDAFEEEDAVSLSEMGQIVEETKDGIERISKTVNGLRRFSRMPSDELTDFDLNQVAEDAIKLAELHRNRGVKVIQSLAKDLPLLHGSEERMEQVLLNLLLNAKQALAERDDGEVFVTTCALRDDIEICIADNGPGFSREVAARIFDPFFTTKSPDEGTGLGLSIAFDIVREHGGVLDVTSREGQGACFTARFPRAMLMTDPDRLA
jgi:signal transduction histidine kinase